MCWPYKNSILDSHFNWSFGFSSRRKYVFETMLHNNIGPKQKWSYREAEFQPDSLAMPEDVCYTQRGKKTNSNCAIFLLFSRDQRPFSDALRFIRPSVYMRDDPWHKAVSGDRVGTRGFKALEQVVVIRANWGSSDEMGFLMMRLILPHSPYHTQAPEHVCDVMVQYMMVWQRAQRMNGIRPTCVIQLACERGLGPLPSAGGDKEVGV